MKNQYDVRVRSFAGTIVPKKHLFNVQMCSLDIHVIKKHNIILLSFTRRTTFVKIKIQNLKKQMGTTIPNTYTSMFSESFGSFLN